MEANLIASASIGCVLCCQGCNADRLRNGFTFLPPMASYRIENVALARQKSGRGGALEYQSQTLGVNTAYARAAETAQVRIVRTSCDESIPLVWVRDDSIPEDAKPLVILHCHGNATDIGLMMATYSQLSRLLQAEVVGVEYTGYGSASGTPSIRNACADAVAAYDYVCGTGVAPERIVAYGQSVGSGPVLALASDRRLGGVLLHSPLLSGIRVVDPSPDACCRPSSIFRCMDFFRNDRRVRSVNCPIFVIHGSADDVIPQHHGVRLHEATPAKHRWPAYYPADAGHSDIIEKEGTKYFLRVGAFLRGVRLQSKLGDSQFISDLATEEEASGVLLGPPGQNEMLENEMLRGYNNLPASQSNLPRQGTPTDASEIQLLYKEPIVGPSNGLYSQWRAAATPAFSVKFEAD